MVDAVDWGARRRTLTVPVDGFDVTFRKRGLGNLNEVLWSTPGLGEVFQSVGDALVKETDPTARRAAVEAALKDALKAVASSGGSTPGQVAFRVAKGAIPTLLDILAEDAVLASEDERGPYREWLSTLGFRGLLDAISGWIKLNMPEGHGPFVRLAATWLLKARVAMDAMEQSVERSFSPAPAPSATPTLEEVVPDPMPEPAAA